MNRFAVSARKALLSLAAPVLAVLFALAITGLILVIAGDPVDKVFSTLLSWPRQRVIVAILNAAIPYYLAAVAAAIGFRMNLFNIGTEGQYRMGAFFGAFIGGLGLVPGLLNVILATLAAMLAGGLWAAIPAWLKVSRGVSEVISTIMLNAIATSLIAFLLRKVRYSGGDQNVVQTTPLPQDSWLEGFRLFPKTRTLYAFVIVALLVGFLYWFILNKTRFGFDLRATGRSESAAVASGVGVKKMVVASMLLSGATAGLVGMPLLFAEQPHSYGSTFQAGIGFVGLGIALLGRNHPIGMAFAAILWSFLDAQSNALQISANVSDRLVLVIQGVIVLSVVIAYEIVRRANVRLDQRTVARELAQKSTTEPEGAAA